MKYLLFFILFLSLTACSEEKIESPEQTEKETAYQENKIEEEIEEIKMIELIAIGDILIHQSIIRDAQTNNGTYDFRPMFQYVEDYIQKADIAVANQETMIGGEGLGLSGYPMFNSPYELGDSLKDVGFDVVTMANNHTLDRGIDGVLNATTYWDKIGVARAGAYQNQEDRDRVTFVEENDISVAFLSYTYGTNGIPIPEGKEYLVNLIDLELMKKDIQKAKNNADVVVVAMHWGAEYQREPNEEQKELAQWLSDQEVDIIIGNHPHVLQPVQWIEGESGNQTYVMYSLGNFISAQDQLYRLIGGIAGIKIEKKTKGEETIITLKDPTFLPVYTHYQNWSHYMIYPMHELKENQLKNTGTHYDEIVEHMQKYIKDLEIIK